MITHNTLFALANLLGTLAMVTVVAYHIIAVNAKVLSQDSGKVANK